jgi:DNA ligase D-like protein (predicted 3'-phosphoesterase)
MSPDRLERYHAKRNFDRTPEPRGGRVAKEGKGGGRRRRRRRRPIFVVQKHAARSLHYDFRLEVDGVLKSWAVPKGPSTDPREKRLAVEVEDHPLDYGDFEGLIGDGNYGAGSVIVWDTGPYRAEGDIHAMLADGHVRVWLKGEKLRGGYLLQRTRRAGRQQQWLLIKRRDEGADARRNPVSTQPASVLSGRTVEEVASEREQQDDSRGPHQGEPGWRAGAKRE